MPRYRFVCADCDEQFEESMAATEEWPACPVCGSTNIERKMPKRVSTKYKGDGFTKSIDYDKEKNKGKEDD